MDDYRGEEFLNKKNPSLHTSDEVMHSAEKSDSPKEKIRRYLDRLERITQKAMDNERTTSENDHNLLRNLYYRKYVIKKENVPDSHFELQEQIAMERGEGYLKHNEDSKEAERDYIVSEQKHSLDTWIDYLESEDANAYPMWFKYYALQGMVKLGSYNKVEGKFNKRTESTVSPFVELDREALAIVYDELNKYLNKEEINDEDLKKILDGGNFGKLYAYAIKKKESSLKDDPKSDEGVWKKYEQGSDPNLLFNDIYGKGTGWCTAGSIDVAAAHISGGDFYVYYTKDRNGEFTCPRIAIRKENGKIAEIRGIEPRQNIESNMENVVNKKLEDPEFPDRDMYKEKVEDMQMMTYIHTKWKCSGNLDIRDLRFLYEIDGPIIGFGYKKDPRIKEIIETRDNKQDLAMIFGVAPKELSCDQKTALKDNCKIHVGSLILPVNLSNCEVPQIVHLQQPSHTDFSKVKELVNVKFSSLGSNTTEIKFYNGKLIQDVSFPEGLEEIDFFNSEVKGYIHFPSTLKRLHINRLDKINELELNEGLEYLYIKDASNIQNLKLPSSIIHLSLACVKNLESISWPSKLKTLELSNLKKIDTLILPKQLKKVDLSSLEEVKCLILPENPERIVLPFDFDFNCIELPKDKNSQEKIIKAIEDGYRIRSVKEGSIVVSSDPHARAIETARADVAISRLKKHFAEDKVYDAVKTDTPVKVHQKEKPSILSVPKQKILTLKEKTVGIVNQVLSTTKERLQSLKETILQEKKHINDSLNMQPIIEGKTTNRRK